MVTASGPGVSDILFCFFFSSRRRHTRLQGDWSSDVCSSDLILTSRHHHFWFVAANLESWRHRFSDSMTHGQLNYAQPNCHAEARYRNPSIIPDRKSVV